MASSNVNTGFAKCYISFMAIVILLQGCIYLALALYGITQQSCSNEETTDISQNPFGFVMRLIYFQRENCGNPKITAAGLSNGVEIEMTWSKSFVITNRMNILLITYAAVSSLWIVTSLIVLVSICGTVTNIVAAISFWPWFLIVIGGSVLDGVATGYFVFDIIHTTTVSDAFEYIGAVTTNTALMNILESFDAYFVTPAVVLACLSSRVVLIWLLNIFGTGFCLSLSRVLAKNNSALAKTQQITDSVSGEQEANNENTEMKHDLQQSEQMPRTTSDRPQLILKEMIRTPDQTPNNPQSNYTQLTPNAFVATPSDSKQLKTHQSNTTYLNRDTHPDRLDYPAAKAGPSSPSLFDQKNQLSTETPLNSRYTKSEFSLLPNQRVSAELRSQLPWSYTSAQGKPQVPLKPQRQMYPEIPEPDYI